MGPDPPAAGSPAGDRLQKALDKSKVTEFNSRLAQLRQEQDTESLKRELDELKALNSVVRGKLVDAGALQAFRETFGREMRPLTDPATLPPAVPFRRVEGRYQVLN